MDQGWWRWGRLVLFACVIVLGLINRWYLYSVGWLLVLLGQAMVWDKSPDQIIKLPAQRKVLYWGASSVGILLAIIGLFYR
jgi:energy-coupling factor transporter transmembrane protein EcfT